MGDNSAGNDHRALLQQEAAQLLSCIESLKSKRDTLTEEIVDEDAEKTRLTGELRILADQLCRINENLLHKRAMKEEYDASIRQGETTYAKLVDTSRAIVRGIKEEMSALKVKEERLQAAAKTTP